MVLHTSGFEFNKWWCFCVSQSVNAGSFCEIAWNRPTMTPTGVVSMSVQNLSTEAAS